MVSLGDLNNICCPARKPSREVETVGVVPFRSPLVLSLTPTAWYAPCCVTQQLCVSLLELSCVSLRVLQVEEAAAALENSQTSERQVLSALEAKVKTLMETQAGFDSQKPSGGRTGAKEHAWCYVLFQYLALDRCKISGPVPKGYNRIHAKVSTEKRSSFP